MIKSGDSGDLDVARYELASSFFKKDLVVRARLRRMFSKATNMTAELRGREIRNESDWHVASVTLPDKRTVTISAGIFEEFWNYFLYVFARESGLYWVFFFEWRNALSRFLWLMLVLTKQVFCSL